MIKKGKYIYVLAPANTSTGGPEALHQLAYTIKNNTKYNNVFMYYGKGSSKNSIHKNFVKYNLPVANEIIDHSKNLIIVSELYTDISFLNNYNKIKKVIWWLSIDNYLLSFFKNNYSKLTAQLIKIPFKIIKIFNKLTFYTFGDYTFFDYLKFLFNKKNFLNKFQFKDIKYHFHQSDYAKEILSDNGYKSYQISDYLNDSFLKKKYFFKKKDLITYNPIKCTDFLNFIIKKYPYLKFIPLVGLSRAEMIKILKKSKIYIDFGNHPGKDRIPREAAILGNCVLVNKNGSASNASDIEISNCYKFNEKKDNIKNIISLINICIEDYDIEYKKFKPYVIKIRNEKKLFIRQVKDFFKHKYK